MVDESGARRQAGAEGGVMALTEEYECPFCGRPTIITDESYSKSTHALYIQNADGLRAIVTTFRVCPNPKCRRQSLKANLYSATWMHNKMLLGSPLSQWDLIPPSAAKS